MIYFPVACQVNVLMKRPINTALLMTTGSLCYLRVFRVDMKFTTNLNTNELIKQCLRYLVERL